MICTPESCGKGIIFLVIAFELFKSGELTYGCYKCPLSWSVLIFYGFCFQNVILMLRKDMSDYLLPTSKRSAYFSLENSLF